MEKIKYVIVGGRSDKSVFFLDVSGELQVMTIDIFNPKVKMKSLPATLIDHANVPQALDHALKKIQSNRERFKEGGGLFAIGVEISSGVMLDRE